MLAGTSCQAAAGQESRRRVSGRLSAHAGLSRMLALMLPVYVPAIPASGLLSPGRRSNLLRIVSK